MSVYKRPLRSDELMHWSKKTSNKSTNGTEYEIRQIDREIHELREKILNPSPRLHPGDIDLYRNRIAVLKERKKSLMNENEKRFRL